MIQCCKLCDIKYDEELIDKITYFLMEHSHNDDRCLTRAEVLSMTGNIYFAIDTDTSLIVGIVCGCKSVIKEYDEFTNKEVYNDNRYELKYVYYDKNLLLRFSESTVIFAMITLLRNFDSDKNDHPVKYIIPDPDNEDMLIRRILRSNGYTKYQNTYQRGPLINFDLIRY